MGQVAKAIAGNQKVLHQAHRLGDLLREGQLRLAVWDKPVTSAVRSMLRGRAER